MKILSWYWNVIHYFIFKFEKKASYVINFPIKWLLHCFFEIPYIKKGLEKRGSSKNDIFKESENVLNNPETGINSIWAGIQMGGIFVLFEYGIFNIIQGFIGKSLIQHIWENKLYAIVFALVLLGIAGLFNYFVLFKEDRYLNYFHEFEKMPRDKKIKYGLSCFVIIFLIFLFVITSFVFVPGENI